jgi:hypothetical protein
MGRPFIWTVCGRVGGPALLRHIHFHLSNASIQRELFGHHLPNPDQAQANYAILMELSRGLSGGDILNVCVNAIYAGSVDVDPAKWMVTQGDAGAGDCEREEGEGGALGGDEMAKTEDWVSAGVIARNIAFEVAGAIWPSTWSGVGV